MGQAGGGGGLKLDRRSFLLGLGAAPLFGCTDKPKWSYDGRFVEDDSGLGHRLLRDHGGVSLPLEEGVERREALILGAGVSGLVAAWRLRQGGVKELAVLELSKEPGGTAVGGRSEVTGYPWAAHYLPAPPARNAALVKLLDEFGLVEGYDPRGEPQYLERWLCAEPVERVYQGGRWHRGLFTESLAVGEDARAFAQFKALMKRWIGEKDGAGRRAFDLPVAAGADTPALRALDQISMAEWMRQHGLHRSKMLRWYVQNACWDDFGCEPEDTSAYYGLHYFCARTERPEQDSAHYLTWPNGNQWLVQRLVERLAPGQLSCGQVVVSVRQLPGEVEVIAAHQGRRRRWRAPRVIFALPSYLRPYLLAEPGPYRPSYAPWLTANLHLSGRPKSRGFPGAWDNTIYGARSVGYVVATHQEGSSWGPTVWTYYRPLPSADVRAARARLLGLEWEQAAASITAELAPTQLDLQAHLRKVELRRFGHGMVRPTVGTRFSPARLAAAQPVGGLYFAHSDLSGVALFEEAFYQGHRAAEELLAARGKEA